MQVPLQTSAQQDRTVLVTICVRIVERVCDCDGVELLASFLFEAAEKDNDVAVVVAWSPEKVVLMSADRFRQSILRSEEIDRGSLAVVTAKDRRALLLLGRE